MRSSASIKSSSSSSPSPDGRRVAWRVANFDLGSTLDSGQAFRWEKRVGAWEGVVGARWVRLVQAGDLITAETALPQPNWDWIAHYLQLHVDLSRVIATFPPDPPLQDAVSACRGLRLLRQDPWECLASFVLSSTKQIVQIRQIIAALCERFGDRVDTPSGATPAWQFPSPGRLAACGEAELRACKAGFRAPYLRAIAERVAGGSLDLAGLGGRPLSEARATLMALPGVGRKIADCVLLFAGGFEQAFPVDVWVERALRDWYFPAAATTPRALREFSETHFGPHAGYAQQYLFCHRRRGADRGVEPHRHAGSDGVRE